ncbi:MAG: hypothetical protein WBG19_06600 [Thermoplasmata archaeon]
MITVGSVSISANVWVNITVIGNSSHASESTFAADISRFFGIDLTPPAGTSIDNAAVVLVSLGGLKQYVQALNTEWNTTAGYLCPSLGIGCFDLMQYLGHYFNATKQITLFGYWEAFTPDTLTYALSEVESDLVSILGILKSPSDILSVLSSALSTITSNLDLGFGILTPQGQNFEVQSLNSISLSSISKYIGTLSQSSSISESIEKEVDVITEIAKGSLSAETVVGAIFYASQAVITSIDLVLDWLAPGSAWTQAVDWLTGVIDPSGSTDVPALNNASGTILGYNESTGSTTWSQSRVGFLEGGYDVSGGNDCWVVFGPTLSQGASDEFAMTQVGNSGVNVPFDSTLGSNLTAPVAIASGYLADGDSLETGAVVNSTGGAHIDWSNQLSDSILRSNVWTGSSFVVSGRSTHDGRPASAAITAYLAGSEVVSTLTGNGWWNLTLSASYEASRLEIVATSASQFETATIVALPALYSLTVSETGLPLAVLAAKGWFVRVDGIQLHLRSISAALIETNGTYPYTVSGPAGYRITSPSGDEIVSGANLALALTITRGPTYTLKFHETGQAIGTKWCVSIGSTLCGIGPNVVYENLTPAIYSYSIGAIVGMTTLVKLGTAWVVGSAGSKSIIDASVTVQVRFAYAVSFIETGLPGGTGWIATSQGQTVQSTTDSILIYITNGSHAFTVHGVPGYSRSPASGTLRVTGAPLTEAISFRT